VQACTTATGVGETAGCGPGTNTFFTKKVESVNGLTAQHIVNGVALVWNDLLGRYPSALSTPGQLAAEPENYLVEVTTADDTDFSSPVVSAVVDRGCSTHDVTTCYQPTGVVTPAGQAEYVLHGLPDGSYLWRVTPVDLSTNELSSTQGPALNVDTTGPTFSLTDKNGVAATSALHVTVDDPNFTGTVSQSTLNVVPLVGPQSAVAGSWSGSGASWTFQPSSPLTTGQRYSLAVVGALADTSGNPARTSSRSVRVTTTADDKSAAWSFGSGWTRHSASNAIKGTFERARSGHSATLPFAGTGVKVYGCKGPSLGKVQMIVDGAIKATVNEHKSFSQCGVLLWSGSASSTLVHTLKVKVSTGVGTIDEATVS
jgi:hypothetical protein